MQLTVNYLVCVFYIVIGINGAESSPNELQKDSDEHGEIDFSFNKSSSFEFRELSMETTAKTVDLESTLNGIENKIKSLNDKILHLNQEYLLTTSVMLNAIGKMERLHSKGTVMNQFTQNSIQTRLENFQEEIKSQRNSSEVIDADSNVILASFCIDSILKNYVQLAISFFNFIDPPQRAEMMKIIVKIVCEIDIGNLRLFIDFIKNIELSQMKLGFELLVQVLMENEIYSKSDLLYVAYQAKLASGNRETEINEVKTKLPTAIQKIVWEPFIWLEQLPSCSNGSRLRLDSNNEGKVYTLVKNDDGFQNWITLSANDLSGGEFFHLQNKQTAKFLAIEDSVVKTEAGFNGHSGHWRIIFTKGEDADVDAILLQNRQNKKYLQIGWMPRGPYFIKALTTGESFQPNVCATWLIF